MDNVLASITIIIVLGISAQWIAWRIRLPSILLLLVCGFMAGPVLGWLNPDRLTILIGGSLGMLAGYLLTFCFKHYCS
jgi:Kef-type K+ transport system membrane component KefB